MSFASKLIIVVSAALSVGSVACVVGETRTEVIEYNPHLAVAGMVCNSPYVKPDLKSLKACHAAGTGKGHCYSKAKSGTNAENAKEVADPTCKDDEICIADKVLEAGGTDALKKCTFRAAGKDEEGRCMANLAQQMSANFKYMKSTEKDGVCDDDEACSPCIDPRNKESTGICGKVGVHEEDCTEGAKGKQLELCCAGLGICMPSDSVPGGAADSLPKDSCKSKDAPICTPANLIDGKGETCEIAGQDGVCLPTCFADMVKGAQSALRSSCNALSFCLPCAAAKAAGYDMPGCK
jgi:hypothetical protein